MQHGRHPAIATARWPVNRFLVSILTGAIMPDRAWSGLLLLVTAAIAGGCGSPVDPNLAKRPAVAPAEGTVKYKGEPVAGATLVLSPTGGDQYGASAMTDESGNFVLSAFPPTPGVVPGSYQVSITKLSVSAQQDLGESHDAEVPPAETPKSLIPEKYSNPASSGLTADIPQEGKTDLQFELQDQP